MSSASKGSIFSVLIVAVALYFYNFSGDDVSAPTIDPTKPTVEELAIAKAKDPHYLDIGFFDIHYCNWPDRKPFFLNVFSSFYLDQVEKVSIYLPNGEHMTDLDLAKFRKWRSMNKKTGKKQIKKAALLKNTVEENFVSGWYTAKVFTKDGQVHEFKDLVDLKLMDRAKPIFPEEDAELETAPTKFEWQKIEGAKHYQVFIYDTWKGKKVHSSKLLDTNSYTPPLNNRMGFKLMKPGGEYQWRVHARDMNGDPVYGDFNAGSQTHKMEFTIEDSE